MFKTSLNKKIAQVFVIASVLFLSASPVFAESLQQRVQNVCSNDPYISAKPGFASEMMGMCEAVSVGGFQLAELNFLIQRSRDAASGADRLVIRQTVDFAANDCADSWKITIQKPQ